MDKHVCRIGIDVLVFEGDGRGIWVVFSAHLIIWGPAER